MEAGLRSDNRKMPEEINRILTDHASDILFAPTSTAHKRLLSEGIPQNKIVRTGDVMRCCFNFQKSGSRKVFDY